MNQRDVRLTELQIDSCGNSLYGWQFGEETDTVVLYFGGDSADSSGWIRKAVLDHASAWEGTAVLTLDYPAFGKSRGIISERYFYETAESLYAYTVENFPQAKICVMGYSIGSAAALYLGHLFRVDGMILVAPMYDGTSLYLPRKSFLHAFFEPFATVQMENEYFAARCQADALVFASDSDRMTQIEDIRSLCSLFPVEPVIVTVPSCGHGEYWEHDAVYDAIRDYLNHQ